MPTCDAGSRSCCRVLSPVRGPHRQSFSRCAGAGSRPESWWEHCGVRTSMAAPVSGPASPAPGARGCGWGEGAFRYGGTGRAYSLTPHG